MLGCADKLARGLAAPASLGTHHPPLPAPALFFQHPVQCHLLATLVVGGFTDLAGDALPCARRRRLPVDPHLPCPKSSAPVHAGTRFGFTVVARAGERFASSGALAGR